MTKKPPLSIVVSAYNEEKYIGECLAHILKNALPDTEIIVIDNASTDNTKKIAESYGVKVFTETKQGVSFARQRGYLESTGDIIGFLDADTCMPAGWMEKVTQIFQKDSKVSLVSGPYNYYDLAWNEKMICYLFGPLFYIGSFFVGPMAIGGNLAIRRTSLDAIGGFDTSIEFYGDDTDIARRAAKVGKIVFPLTLMMPTSGRRLHAMGVTKTHLIYLVNYFSVSLRGKPKHSTYEKFR